MSTKYIVDLQYIDYPNIIFYGQLARPAPATCENLVLWPPMAYGPRQWIKASNQLHVVAALVPGQQSTVPTG